MSAPQQHDEHLNGRGHVHPYGHEHSPDEGPDHGTHGHDHDHPQGHEHPYDQGPHDHGDGHEHTHPRGVRGFFQHLFVPHAHDAADSIDDAIEASTQGIRAVKISLVLMLVTAVVQAVIVAYSGSVALLADTIHNFSDALTAVPLWIAFVLGRRAATRRYTYGYHRAEDLAGLFIVFAIALSAVLAAWQAIDRLIYPRPLENLGWVIAAGIVGFLGNEAVAIYRIRIGRRIGSAALVADGIHARTDGFTSLAVVVGGVGALLGFPQADPIVGLLISALIAVLLIGTIRSVGRRLMDGVEPDDVDAAEQALHHVEQVTAIEQLRLRWVGHRLRGDAVVRIPDVPLAQANAIAAQAERSVKAHLPNLDEITITTLAASSRD